MTDDSETVFASLLASRLCHDLVNPAGALSTALDVLANESDEEMRRHADSLLKESTDRLLAVIEFARVAYGASGGAEGELATDALQSLAKRLYAHLKPELQWTLPPQALPKREARALMNLLLCADRMAPRAGSVVTVAGGPMGFLLTAEGRRAAMPEDLEAVLKGSDDYDEPKLMPGRLAFRLAKSAGKDIVIHAADEHVTVTLR